MVKMVQKFSLKNNEAVRGVENLGFFRVYIGFI